jgi:hypothetical protein
MCPQVTMLNRREELHRRVEALPREVKDWQDRCQAVLDLNAHYSQLQAIDILMAGYVAKQRDLLKDLKTDGDLEVFRTKAFELVEAIIKAQEVWDFFREKLELRFSPTFKEPLWIADTVAWDCHRPVIEKAADTDILERAQMREPPLTYLGARFSPLTWVRGVRPYDGRDYLLGKAEVPIPVIELPWDHLENLWELLSIHHEVGHDIEADLKLHTVLEDTLKMALASADPPVPAERIRNWLAWRGEVFADLTALQLGGPAFIEALLHLLLLPAAKVVTFDPKDPHPTPYLRLLLTIAYARTLVPKRPAALRELDRLEARWKALYGEQPQFKEYIADFPLVFQALMDTPFEELKGQPVRKLIPYAEADDDKIRHAASYLGTGQNAPERRSIAPRHCISAARLAVTRAAVADENQPAPIPVVTADQIAERLQAINQCVADLVRDNAQPGLRAAGAPPSHRRFIASFADRLPDAIRRVPEGQP